MKPLTLPEFLRDEMERKKMNITEFSKLVGVNHAIIGKFLLYGIESTYGGKKVGQPSYSFLKKLAKATNHDLCTVLSLVEPELTRVNPRASRAANFFAQLPPDKLQLFDTFLKGLGFEDI